MAASAFSINLNCTVNSSLDQIVDAFDKVVIEQRNKSSDIFDDVYLDIKFGEFKAVFRLND
jgi:hypothetical protein